MDKDASNIIPVRFNIPQRYEDDRDRIMRIVSNNREMIEKMFGDKYQMHAVETGAIDVIYSAAASPTLKFDSRERQNILAKIKEMIPSFRVSPAGMHFNAFMRPNDNGKGHGIHCSARRIDPVIISTDVLGDMLIIRGETMFPAAHTVASDLIVSRAQLGPEAIAEFVKVLNDAFALAQRAVRSIRVYMSDPIPITEQSWTTWDKVFLAPQVATDIRDDLIFFVENEVEFRKAGIPYKRGYLLHGPPGNGKSTVCRAIATSMPFVSFSFDFSNADFSNVDLTRAFQEATNNAPSVFFLEDIDRIWSKANNEDGNGSGITLDHLLNSIDGIATHDGLVIVATANDPRTLDPAILNRPGRFDAIIELGMPDYDLRLKFLKWLFRKTSLREVDLIRIAELSEGVSMSHLKEIFILAVKSAVKLKRDVAPADAEIAVFRVMEMFNGVPATSYRKAGFDK